MLIEFCRSFLIPVVVVFLEYLKKISCIRSPKRIEQTIIERNLQKPARFAKNMMSRDAGRNSILERKGRFNSFSGRKHSNALMLLSLEHFFIETLSCINITDISRCYSDGEGRLWKSKCCLYQL